MYANLRAILADEPSITPAPASGLDPRTQARLRRQHLAGLRPALLGLDHVPAARRSRRRASPTPAEERAERLGWFGGPTTLGRARRRIDPDAVAGDGRRLARGRCLPRVRLVAARPVDRPARRGRSSSTGRGRRTGGSATTSRCTTTNANDLWGIATYDGVLAAGRDPGTFSNAGGSRPDTGPLPVDDRHGRRRPLEAAPAREPRLHARPGARRPSRACAPSATT